MTSLIGFITHYTGNLLVRRFKRGGAVPGWVESGLSHYYEGTLNGFRTLSITEYTGYENVEKWDMELQTFAQWYKKMADPEFRRSLPRIGSFKDTIVEELPARELVKSYFLVYWLMAQKPAPFVEYVRAAYQEKGAIRHRMSEDEAFQLAFQCDPEALEAEFEEWAKREITSLPPIGP